MYNTIKITVGSKVVNFFEEVFYMRKRILAIIMVLAMVCTSLALTVPSSASAVGVNKATYAVPTNADNVKTDEATGISTVSVGEKATLSWKGLRTSKPINNGKLDLEPKGWGTEKKGDSYVDLTFEVTKAGEYEVIISYTGDTKANGTSTKYNEDLIVNGGDAQALDLALDPRNGATVSVKVKLNEGKNTLRLSNPDAPTEKYHYNYYIKLLSIAVKGEGVYADKVDFVEPLAAYDFTVDLKDHSANKQADVVLDDEPKNEEGGEARSDKDRLAAGSHSGRASLKEGGIYIENGFFSLPSDLMSKVDEKDITGLTISFTLTTTKVPWVDYNDPKLNDNWWYNGDWARMLYSFSAKDVYVGKDGTGELPEAEREPASFILSANGNVGTAVHQYNSSGAWMDGSLGERVKRDYDVKHTVTVTYDTASNEAVIYFDGAKLNSSKNSSWTVGASLTPAQIKSFTSFIFGRPNAGQNGAWNFGTYESVTLYTSALSAEQVGVLYEGGYKALLDGDHVLEKVTDNKDGTHTIACTNKGCSYSVVEKCVSSEKDCTKDAHCDKCNSLVREAGKHPIEKWEDAGNGLHKGTCPTCGAEVTAPHTAAESTDCTNDVVCKDCGAVITEGCADHAWTEWKDDGEGHHVRTCQNKWCTGKESEAHTYTSAMNVCPKCGAANPNYKAPVVTDPADTDPPVTDPVTDPADTDPAVTDPAVTDPAVTDPATTDPAVTDPSTTPGDEGGKGPSDEPPQTGDSGIALFVTLAVVSAASIAVTVAVPGKKRH